jgi:hypothetical protein
MTKPRIRMSSAAALLVVALGASGCKGPVDPSQNVTSPCPGSVQPLSYGPICSFTISNNGEFTVTMTSLIPGQAYIGLGYGLFSGGTCQFQQAAPLGPSNIGTAALSGQVLATGTYCVQAFDPSLQYAGYPSLVVPQNYVVQVSHP